jgi:hypothetical protein
MSLGAFLKTLGHDIKTVAIKISDGFTAIFGKQAAADFAKAALALLKSDLGQIVVAEVETLAGVSTLTGVQKAATAQAAVLKQAETLGLSASTSIVNMLIELAVQFVTGHLTAAEVTVAPPSTPAAS